MFGLPDLALQSEHRIFWGFGHHPGQRWNELDEVHDQVDQGHPGMEQHRVGMGFVVESVWVQVVANGPTAAKLEVLFL